LLGCIKSGVLITTLERKQRGENFHINIRRAAREPHGYSALIMKLEVNVGSITTISSCHAEN
jgi:hypothetical protein